MASFSKRGLYWRAQTWARSIANEMDRGVYIDRSEAERTTLLEAIERYEKETIARKGYPGQELQRTKHWKGQPLAKRFLATLRGVDFAKYRDLRMDSGRAAVSHRPCMVGAWVRRMRWKFLLCSGTPLQNARELL